MSKQIRCGSIAAVVLLMLAAPAVLDYTLPLLAQTGGDSSSASQNYQDFQSCLSNTEVGGYASEQQIRDCLDQIYETGASSSSSDAASDDENDSTGSSGNGDDEDNGGDGGDGGDDGQGPIDPPEGGGTTTPQ